MDHGSSVLDAARALEAVNGFPRIKEIAAEPYEVRGILNSEMALVIGLIVKHRVDLVVESGRARGQSTYLLAKYLRDYDVGIHSFERDRDKDAVFCEERLRGMHAHLYYGDGVEGIRACVAAKKNRRIAILLDGPKGDTAIDLLKECAAHENVVLGFIHDMKRLDRGEESQCRRRMQEQFPSAFFSDAADYVVGTYKLDELAIKTTPRKNWLPHHISRRVSPGLYEYVFSYGPTIGAVLLNGS